LATSLPRSASAALSPSLAWVAPSSSHLKSATGTVTASCVTSATLPWLAAASLLMVMRFSAPSVAAPKQPTPHGDSHVQQAEANYSFKR